MSSTLVRDTVTIAAPLPQQLPIVRSAARFKAFPEFQDMLAGRKTPAEALA